MSEFASKLAMEITTNNLNAYLVCQYGMCVYIYVHWVIHEL